MILSQCKENAERQTVKSKSIVYNPVTSMETP